MVLPYFNAPEPLRGEEFSGLIAHHTMAANGYLRPPPPPPAPPAPVNMPQQQGYLNQRYPQQFGPNFDGLRRDPPTHQFRTMHDGGPHSPNLFNAPSSKQSPKPSEGVPTSYEGFRLLKDLEPPKGEPSWSCVFHTPMEFEEKELLHMIKEQDSKGTVSKHYDGLRSPNQRLQIDRLIEGKRNAEKNPDAQWVLCSVRDVRGPSDKKRKVIETKEIQVILKRQRKKPPQVQFKEISQEQGKEKEQTKQPEKDKEKSKEKPRTKPIPAGNRVDLSERPKPAKEPNDGFKGGKTTKESAPPLQGLGRGYFPEHVNFQGPIREQSRPQFQQPLPQARPIVLSDQGQQMPPPPPPAPLQPTQSNSHQRPGMPIDPYDGIRVMGDSPPLQNFRQQRQPNAPFGMPQEPHDGIRVVGGSPPLQNFPQQRQPNRHFGLPHESQDGIRVVGGSPPLQKFPQQRPTQQSRPASTEHFPPWRAHEHQPQPQPHKHFPGKPPTGFQPPRTQNFPTQFAKFPVPDHYQTLSTSDEEEEEEDSIETASYSHASEHYSSPMTSPTDSSPPPRGRQHPAFDYAATKPPKNPHEDHSARRRSHPRRPSKPHPDDEIVEVIPNRRKERKEERPRLHRDRSSRGPELVPRSPTPRRAAHSPQQSAGEIEKLSLARVRLESQKADEEHKLARLKREAQEYQLGRVYAEEREREEREREKEKRRRRESRRSSLHVRPARRERYYDDYDEYSDD